MTAKTFEVRDEGTFMPVLAVKLEPGNEQDRYLLARTGYGQDPGAQAEYVMLWRLAGGTGPASTDLYEWGGSRTMQVAHDYINQHFDEMKSGAVVDVQFIRGETKTPKLSESFTSWPV